MKRKTFFLAALFCWTLSPLLSQGCLFCRSCVSNGSTCVVTALGCIQSYPGGNIIFAGRKENDACVAAFGEYAYRRHSYYKADDLSCSSNPSECPQIVTYRPCSDVMLNSENQICLGEDVTLNISGGLGYLWSTGDETSNICVAPEETTEYQVLVWGEGNCAELFTVLVEVVECAGSACEPVEREEPFPEPACDECGCEEEFLAEQDALDDEYPGPMPPPAYIQALSGMDKVAHPNRAGPPPCECAVNTYTGNLYIEIPLFYIPAIGPDLKMTLAYNSGKTALNYGYGYGWTWNYNLLWEQKGEDVVIRRGDGRKDVFTFDGAAYRAPPGITDTLLKTDAGQVRLISKIGMIYHFEETNHRRLTKVSDRNQNELLIEYTDTLATQIRDASGRILQLEYENGLLKEVAEPNSDPPRSYCLQYDQNGALLEIKDPLGYTRRYVSDLQKNIVQTTDRNGRIAKIDFDERHAVTQLRSALSKTQFSYDTSLLQTTVFQPVGDSMQLTRYDFDERGRVKGISGNCCGYDVQYERDERNNVTKLTDARGSVYHFAYDSLGNVLTETDPLGNQQSFGWNKISAALASRTDKNGNMSSCDFDEWGNVVQINLPGGYTRSFTWRPDGLMQTATNTRGYTTTYVYDANGNPAEIQYPIGTVKNGFDALGNTLYSVTPNGDTSFIAYDARNLPLKITDPLGHSAQSAYDGNGNEVWMQNRRGFVTTYLFDAYNRLIKTSEPLGLTTEYGYDEANNLIWQKDPNGNLTQYRYNNQNQLIAETNALGQSRSWAYDPNGNIVQMVNFRGFASHYVYDALDRKISITNALNETTTFAFDANGNNTSIATPDGVASNFEYDGMDRNKSKNYSFSNENMLYDGEGNLLEEIDGNGNKTIYRYDEMNRLVEVEDALGDRIFYEYDLNGNQTKMIDKMGYPSETEYDALDRPVLQRNALGQETLITYNEEGAVQVMTDRRGHISRYSYDELGRIDSIEYPIGAERFAYDKNSNQINYTDAEGRITQYEYDALDRQIKTIYADQSQTTLSYDENGNVVSLANEMNETGTFTYDRLDRLESMTSPMDETTSYAFNSAGQRISESLPNGNVIHSVFDLDGRLLALNDALGTIKIFTYDNNGNSLTEIDANGNGQTHTYDPLNRLIETTDALGETTRFIYDKNDNIVQTIDREGRILEQTLDSLERRIESIDALGNKTLFTYDQADNLLSITDANNHSTTYEYDALDRQTKEIFADGTAKEYTFDEVGNVLSRKDNKGDLTYYTYDLRNRLLKRDYPDDNDDVFSYDSAGRLLSATNAYATLNYTYDQTGRLLSETLNGHTTAYAYDVPNRIRTLTYPSGQTVLERQDERNRVFRITEEDQEIAAWQYDASGRLLSRSFANGATTTFTYDDNNWMRSLRHTNGDSEFAGFTYSFDKEGNLLQSLKSHQAADSERYAYDANYRLTNFERGDINAANITFDQIFDYDPLGNRQEFIENGQARAYTTNEVNEYTSVGGVSNLIYDDNGNLTQNGDYTYRYDYENRLLEVIQNGSSLANYYYDPAGRRIRKTTNAGEDVRFFFDGARVIEERDENDQLLAEYLYGIWIDDILRMKRDGQTYFYHQNFLGSVVALTNSLGELAERYLYDVYGKTQFLDQGNNSAPQSITSNPYLFTGRRLDGETNLYYYRARFYDTNLGRFLQRDPLGYVDGWNTYEYAGGNPVMRIDPMGETPWLLVGGVIGGVSAVISSCKGGLAGLAEFGKGFVYGLSATALGGVILKGAITGAAALFRAIPAIFRGTVITPKVELAGALMLSSPRLYPTVRAVAEGGKLALRGGAKVGKAALKGVGGGLTAYAGYQSIASAASGDFEEAGVNSAFTTVGAFLGSKIRSCNGPTRNTQPRVDTQISKSQNTDASVARRWGVYKPGPRDLDIRQGINSRRINSTKDVSEWRRPISSSEIPILRTSFLGEGHVKVDRGVWMSIDGKRIFRAKPIDYLGIHGMGKPMVANQRHVHLEILRKTPAKNYKVVKNIHIPIRPILRK